MNKNYDLLGEQLAESGLEMQILGAIAGAVSAGASIFGGISGAQQADKANKAAEKAYEEQKELAEESAKLQNEYNKKVFEASKKDYYAQREFQFESAIKDWQYRNTIQDYNYLQTVRQFSKSVQNYGDQLGFNKLAAEQAYESEQAALADFLTSDAFARQAEKTGLEDFMIGQSFARQAEQVGLNEFATGQAFAKEGQLIESLQAQGRAQLGQAGRGRGKAVQSTLADYGRNMAIMRESMDSTVEQSRRNMAVLRANERSAINQTKQNFAILDASKASALSQSQRNLRDIDLRRYGADLSATANLMIAPQLLPYAPAPEQGPERTFIEPMEVLPGFTAPPVQQSTMAPLISSFGQAAGTLAGINWGGVSSPSSNAFGQGTGLIGNYGGINLNGY